MNNDEVVVGVWPKGSCSGPGRGPGGWACALTWRGRSKILSGRSDGETTANRMELVAVIKALEELSRPVRVEIITNSKYIENAFAQNIPPAAANGDLWQQISALCCVHIVTCRWQKASLSSFDVAHSALVAAQREARVNKENSLVDRCEPLNKVPDLFGSSTAAF